MKSKILSALAVTLALAMALTLAPGCNGHDDDDFYPTAVLRIVQQDGDNNGVPETYSYTILFKDADDEDLGLDPPTVTLPGGSVLATTCSAYGDGYICETAAKAPPGGGDKSEIPPGEYIVSDGDGEITSFTVLTAELTAVDVAYADVATISTAVASTLYNPAEVLDWDTVTGGPAGDYWTFRIENNDGGDDQGQSVSGRTGSWLARSFSAALPAGWDVPDGLIVVLGAAQGYDRGDYYLVLIREAAAPGYVLN